MEDYREELAAFQKVHGKEKQKKLRWEQIEEQMIVYFLFTYYCGTVYDGNPYVKVKMAVISLFAIEEMMFLEWPFK